MGVPGVGRRELQVFTVVFGWGKPTIKNLKKSQFFEWYHVGKNLTVFASDVFFPVWQNAQLFSRHMFASMSSRRSEI